MEVIQRFIASLLILPFVLTTVMPAALASEMPWMPQPGTMVMLTAPFTAAQLWGMSIHPNDPFKFDFLVQRGDVSFTDERKSEEYSKLIKYFLAALAVPDTDQWVNLSPYEKDRIIPDGFGLTEMGRDLLAQDYLLKQLASSLTDPNSGLGKKFWDGIYEEASKRFGTTDVPTDTFNKIWIMPDKAVVFEKNNTVYVLESHLKVMTEKDYLAMKNNVVSDASSEFKEAADIASLVMKKVIIPAIEKEVNEGKDFAPLRQVYSGMLLATWYKRSLKESILGKLYADQGKVKGLDQDPKINQEIYGQYLEAFRKGVFNMIKEDVDRDPQEVIPRKYFSGGTINAFDKAMSNESDEVKARGVIARNTNITDIVVTKVDVAALPVSVIGEKKYVIGWDIEGDVTGTFREQLEGFLKGLSAADAETVRKLMADLSKAEAEGQRLDKDIELNTDDPRHVIEVRYRGQSQFMEYRFGEKVRARDVMNLAKGAFWGSWLSRKSQETQEVLGYIQEVMQGEITRQKAGTVMAAVQGGRVALPVSVIGEKTYVIGRDIEGDVLGTFREQLEGFLSNLSAVEAETVRKLMADLSKAVAEGQRLDKDIKLNMDDPRRVIEVRYRGQAQFMEYQFGVTVRARDVMLLAIGAFRGSWMSRKSQETQEVFGYIQEVMQGEITRQAAGTVMAAVQGGRAALPVSAIGEKKYVIGRNIDGDITGKFREQLEGFLKDYGVADIETIRKLMEDLSRAVAEGSQLNKYIEFNADDQKRVITVQYRGQAYFMEYQFGEKVKARDVMNLAIGAFRGSWMSRKPQETQEVLGYIQEVMQGEIIRQEAGKDAAMVNGGIDFSQSNLDMQIKRDGAGVPLPISQQNLDNIRVDGLVPVILNIKAAAGALNLP